MARRARISAWLQRMYHTAPHDYFVQSASWRRYCSCGAGDAVFGFAKLCAMFLTLPSRAGSNAGHVSPMPMAPRQSKRRLPKCDIVLCFIPECHHRVNIGAYWKTYIICRSILINDTNDDGYHSSHCIERRRSPVDAPSISDSCPRPLRRDRLMP